jgi:hypothetical protein
MTKIARTKDLTEARARLDELRKEAEALFARIDAWADKLHEIDAMSASEEPEQAVRNNAKRELWDEMTSDPVIGSSLQKAQARHGKRKPR